MGSISNDKQTCSFCHLPRAASGCSLCEQPICRSCVQYLHEDTFSMMEKVPVELSHSDYCPKCFDEKVEPARASYEEVVERAKQVHFWPRTFRGHIPVIKKGRVELEVIDGRDRNEVLLKLGYKAALLGFNGLVHGEISSKKVRDHGYQKMTWSAKGIPVKVDEGKLERAEFREVHWRVLHHR